MALALRAGPFGARFRINELTAEASLELHGVRAIGKTEDVHVRAVAAKGMTARAEREAFAEEADDHVVATLCAPRPCAMMQSANFGLFGVYTHGPMKWGINQMSDLATHERDIQQLFSGFAKLKDEVDALQSSLAAVRRPWYREVSVVVSVLAFVFSLGTTIFAYIQSHDRRVHELRAEVRSGVLEFQKLAIDTIKSEQQYRDNATFAALIGYKAGSALGTMATTLSEMAMDMRNEVSDREHLAIATILESAEGCRSCSGRIETFKRSTRDCSGAACLSGVCGG